MPTVNEPSPSQKIAGDALGALLLGKYDRRLTRSELRGPTGIFAREAASVPFFNTLDESVFVKCSLKLPALCSELSTAICGGLRSGRRAGAVARRRERPRPH